MDLAGSMWMKSPAERVWTSPSTTMSSLALEDVEVLLHDVVVVGLKSGLAGIGPWHRFMRGPSSVRRDLRTYIRIVLVDNKHLASFQAPNF